MPLKSHMFVRVGYPNRGDAAYILPGKEYDRALGQGVYRDLMRLVELAEETGWDGVFFPEHHSRAANGLSPAPNIFVANAAARTSHIALGTMGICLSLHTQPLRVAEELALLDNLAGGRLIVGLVRGGDFWAFGIPPAEARGRFEQAVQLIRRAWTEQEPFAFHSDYFDYDMVSALPRPIQQPHPPLWMACNSAESLEFAAREHMAVVTSWSPTEQVAETFDYYRRYAREQCGWEPCEDFFGVSRDVYVAPTMERAIDEAADEVVAGQSDDFGGAPNPAYKKAMQHDTYSERSFSYKSTSHVGILNVRGWDFDRLQRQGLTIVGDPDYVAAEVLRQRQMMGIGHLFVRPMFGRLGPAQAMSSVELYAREVIPYLQRELVGV